MLESPIIFKRNDYCGNCNTERSLECFDKYDRAVNFTYLLDLAEKGTDITGKFDNRELSHFQCKKCKKVYGLDWTKSRIIPTPLRGLFLIDDFLYRNYN